MAAFPSYSSFMQMAHHDLINIGAFLENRFEGRKNYFLFDSGVVYKISRINGTNDEYYKLSIPCYFLTSSGQELYQFVQCKNNMEYLGNLADYISKKHQGRLEYAQITGQIEDKVRHTRWIQVKPRVPGKGK